MEPIEINWDRDDYTDILDRDRRYDSRAYDFVLELLRRLGEEKPGHVTGRELLDAFRDFALDAFGPMTYITMIDWGLSCCEDVGEVVFNLVRSKRIGKTEFDSREDFLGGYDFSREFLDPFRPPQ